MIAAFVIAVLAIAVTSSWFWHRFRMDLRRARHGGTSLARLLVARVRRASTIGRIRRARSAGVSVVTSVRGTNPAVVRYDGVVQGTRYDYSDLRSYKRDVGGRRVPHLTARCCGRPPRVGELIKA